MTSRAKATNSSRWEAELAREVARAVNSDTFWSGRLSALAEGNRPPFRVHLAVLIEPYLEFILLGKKTIESRFGVQRRPPYESVDRGDVIILKRAAGPVVGLCEVSHAWFYALDPASWTTIQRDFARAICAQDDAFWDERKHASFATLIRIQRVHRFDPIDCGKRDRRGWVIMYQKADEVEQLDLRFV